MKNDKKYYIKYKTNKSQKQNSKIYNEDKSIKRYISKQNE